MAKFTIVRHGGSGDWSALYNEDGILVRQGDTSSIEEHVFAQLDVEQEYNPSVFRTIDDGTKYGKETAPASLRELAEWTKEDQDKADRIKSLRLEADQLEKELKR